MQKSKKILFLLLFAALLIPAITPLIIQIKIAWIKMEAERRLETNNLQVVHIPVKNVKWVKQGKEMIINNRLFDVKDFLQNATEIIVTGIYDDIETALEKQNDRLWQQQKSEQGVLVFKYFQVLAQSFLPQHLIHLKNMLPVQKNYAGEIVSSYKEIIIQIPTPPPET